MNALKLLLCFSFVLGLLGFSPKGEALYFLMNPKSGDRFDEVFYFFGPLACSDEYLDKTVPEIEAGIKEFRTEKEFSRSDLFQDWADEFMALENNRQKAAHLLSAFDVDASNPDELSAFAGMRESEQDHYTEIGKRNLGLNDEAVEKVLARVIEFRDRQTGAQ